MGRPKGSKNKSTREKEALAGAIRRADVDNDGGMEKAERKARGKSKGKALRPEIAEAVQGLREVSWNGKQAWVVRYLPVSRSMALVKWWEKQGWESEWVPAVFIDG